MDLDYVKLGEEARNGSEDVQRKVVSTLFGMKDPQARALLEEIEKRGAVTARAAARHALRHTWPERYKDTETSDRVGATATRQRPEFESGMPADLKEAFMNLGVPLIVVIAIGGFLTPAVSAFYFMALYMALVILGASLYNQEIAIPYTLAVVVVSIVVYYLGWNPVFKPKPFLWFLYIGVGIAVSILTTRFRRSSDDARRSLENAHTQMAQLQKVMEMKAQATDPTATINVMKELETKKRALGAKLHTFLMKTKEMVTARSTAEVFKDILSLMTGEIGVRTCSIWVINKKTHEITPVVFSDNERESKSDAKNISIPLSDERLITKVAREGGILTPDDIKKMPDSDKFVWDDKGKSVMAISLDTFNVEKQRYEIKGVLNIEDAGGVELSKEDRDMIRSIVSISAAALSQAGSFEHTVEDLKNAKAMTAQSETEKRKLRNTFSKYLSSSVVTMLEKNPESAKLGGDRKMVTTLFADIRGFTAMSERMQPEQVIVVLNRFLTAMTDAIMMQNGTLDKYIGDAVMAIFGAPLPRSTKDHAPDAFAAVLAGMAIKEAAGKIREALIKGKVVGVHVGVGINTGEAVVGNIGSQQQMNYTVIGDSVNTASRVASVAKPAQVLITKATLELIKDKVKVEKLTPVEVKGKKEPVEIFEVLEVYDPLAI
jgi:class 3 adenylate cyclase